MLKHYKPKVYRSGKLVQISKQSENSFIYITFSPDDAEELAQELLKAAAEARQKQVEEHMVKLI